MKFTIDDNTITEHIDKMVEEYDIHAENITKQQLAACIKQAITCGDFTKYIQIHSDKQQVVYIPYAKEQELLDRIYKLEENLEDRIKDVDDF